MASTNPARGTRDFLPADVRKREYVIGIIKEVYESYGFEPLETPAFENLETLTGKYGEEGGQLMFKILKRGEKLDISSASKAADLADLALRYDLTVPLARVIADNRNELPKFFKRYQIQPVWRADRPARGRYREFYQCDADCIGSTSVLVEAELISAVCEILTTLGFADYVVRINHRDLLTAILLYSGIPEEKHTEAMVALDKIDKIGREKVSTELEQRGIGEPSSQKLLTLVDFVTKGNLDRVFAPSAQLDMLNLFNRLKRFGLSDERISDFVRKNANIKNPELVAFVTEAMVDIKQATRNWGVLDWLTDELSEIELASNGIKEIWQVLDFAIENSLQIEVDPTLARGLSYYTGMIVEVNVPDLPGSLAGGGRYDGLIGMFGKEQIPACGISLGLERILVVMDERGMFPPEIADSTPADVLVTIWNEETTPESLRLAAELRASGLRVTVYPEADKLGKQMKYADSIKVPFVCVLGESEIEAGTATLKNMRTGAQTVAERGKIGQLIKEELSANS